jgi:hypothetical protein
MFKWVKRRKLSKAVRRDMAEAQLTLRTMQLKVREEDAHMAFAYADGLRKVARLLSQRFERSAEDVLLGWGLSCTQLKDASDDLIVAASRASTMLASEDLSVRIGAQGYSFGCLLLHHLYRLRFFSGCAPVPQHAVAADELADHFAQFASSMSRTSNSQDTAEQSDRIPFVGVTKPPVQTSSGLLAAAMIHLNDEGLRTGRAPTT